jgi:UDPglucose 6-dehydrogenase
VASNPEFLQEGKAVEDFFHPSRIVLGVDSERARQLLEEIYRPLHANVLVCDLTTAELIKYAANTFLAMKISYINMVAEVCDAVGADVSMVSRGIGLDKRIGPEFLSAGLGFGGYCFPKDLRGFIHLIEEQGLDASLAKSVEQINLRQPEHFLKKLLKALWVLDGKTIGVLGLAFKPGTDDIREAPSIKLIELLIRQGASVRLYDPTAMPSARSVIPEEPGKVKYCSSPYEVAEGAQALLLVTEWDEFRRLDWNRLCRLMDVPILLDGRNFLDPEAIRAAGFDYLGVGRGTLAPRYAADAGSRHLPASPPERLSQHPMSETNFNQELR